VTPSTEETRTRVISDLILLSDVRWQWDYELSANIADVPAELFQTAADLLELTAYQPEVLNEAEQEAIEKVGWVLAKCEVTFPVGLIELQHNPAWQAVMSAARDALGVIAPDVELSAPEAKAAQNPVGTWEEYFASMEQRPLHPLYAELDKYLPTQGDAFELSCGVGQGARHLTAKGLDVWATDVSGEALTFLYEHATDDQRSHLHLSLCTFETLDLGPDTFDVVVAAFCLFFMPAPLFAEKWPLIKAAIRPGGLFMGQFLGPNDDWAAQGYITHTRAEVEALLGAFEVLHIEEVDQDGRTSMGTDKHWHVFHVVARKP